MSCYVIQDGDYLAWIKLFDFLCLLSRYTMIVTKHSIMQLFTLSATILISLLLTLEQVKKILFWLIVWNIDLLNKKLSNSERVDLVSTTLFSWKPFLFHYEIYLLFIFSRLKIAILHWCGPKCSLLFPIFIIWCLAFNTWMTSKELCNLYIIHSPKSSFI